MTNNEKIAACEAILFASGEPVEIARLAEALEIENDEAEACLAALHTRLAAEESGVCLLKLGNKYQLCSKVEYAAQIRNTERNTIC